MKVRLAAAVSGELGGVSVSAFCREAGVSRKTFYKYRARYLRDGLEGLEDRSRRPKTSPRRVRRDVEDRVVELRKWLGDTGLDAGAATIRWHLEREFDHPPSEATIWRVLVRRGFVVPQPKKRPRRSWRRFEAAAPNECWQIDATHWTLADGTAVEILNVLDDHSRFLVAAQALSSVTTEATWAVFSAATCRVGLPARCLSDNGLAFTGRLRNCEVFFETQLRAVGVLKINARPRHPQTCGKVERMQQTEKKWLSAYADDLHTINDLQHRLDRFTDYYNFQRPHRAIGRVPPAQRFFAGAAAGPGAPIATPQRRVPATVNRTGRLDVRPFQIGVGARYAGQHAEVLIDGTHAAIYIDGQLIRYVVLEPNRRQQPLNRPE